jgi:hypothetical protein
MRNSTPIPAARVAPIAQHQTLPACFNRAHDQSRTWPAAYPSHLYLAGPMLRSSTTKTARVASFGSSKTSSSAALIHFPFATLAGDDTGPVRSFGVGWVALRQPSHPAPPPVSRDRAISRAANASLTGEALSYARRVGLTLTNINSPVSAGTRFCSPAPCSTTRLGARVVSWPTARCDIVHQHDLLGIVLVEQEMR